MSRAKRGNPIATIILPDHIRFIHHYEQSCSTVQQVCKQNKNFMECSLGARHAPERFPRPPCPLRPLCPPIPWLCHSGIHHMKKKILLSWSSGKDSAWTLYLLKQQQTYEVSGLITTINSAFD